MAGCAQGPKDIPASSQAGLIAAARAVEALDCGAIIAAPLPATKSNTETLARAVSLETLIASETEVLPDRFAILLDDFGPENKTFSRQALQTALAARDSRKVRLYSHEQDAGPRPRGPEGL